MTEPLPAPKPSKIEFVTIDWTAIPHEVPRLQAFHTTYLLRISFHGEQITLPITSHTIDQLNNLRDCVD